MIFSSAVILIALGNFCEKIFFSIIVVASIITEVEFRIFNLDKMDLYQLHIDLLIMFSIMYICIKSDSYWPIWFAGFHIITVLTHFSRLLFPNKFPLVYIKAEEFWSIPAMVAMTIGVWLDYRAGLKMRLEV